MARGYAVWFVGAVLALAALSPGMAWEGNGNAPASPARDTLSSNPPVYEAWSLRENQAFEPSLASDLAKDQTLTGTDRGDALKAAVSDLSGQLLSHAKETAVDEYVITMSTFVNLNNLYRTSSLGRYLSEQMISELQQEGVTILEVRKTPMLLMSDKGEYGLSRDMKELDFVHNSQATVVGTYTLANDRLFVNARLIRNSDGMVLSTASKVMELSKVVSSLLVDEGLPRRTAGKVMVRNYREGAPMVSEKKGSGGQNP